MVAYTYAVRGTKISIESCLLDCPYGSMRTAYVRWCVGRQDLTLTVKPKQEKALVIVVHLRLSHRAGLLGSPLAMGSRHAISC